VLGHCRTVVESACFAHYLDFGIIQSECEIDTLAEAGMG
jgi:hypothetical protein